MQSRLMANLLFKTNLESLSLCLYLPCWDTGIHHHTMWIHPVLFLKMSLYCSQLVVNSEAGRGVFPASGSPLQDRRPQPLHPTRTCIAVGQRSFNSLSELRCAYRKRLP